MVIILIIQYTQTYHRHGEKEGLEFKMPSMGIILFYFDFYFELIKSFIYLLKRFTSNYSLYDDPQRENVHYHFNDLDDLL